MTPQSVLSADMQYWVAVAQLVGAIAVVVGAFVAIIAILCNGATAKKTQTATFLFESKHDNGYWEGHKVIRKISESKTKSFIFYLEDALETEDAEDRRHIHYYLNFFERVAVSVKSKIYNEDMLKKVFYSTAVKNYESAEPFIRGLRAKFNSQTYYQEYEWLVKRWKASPLKESNKK
ncbi:DUF4760 domain-containing protein [Morganella morganii subsp. morganii]|uniref:DUF4760 domain-containing protein n=1 Tax=Morganella morganii TaxID=582 RepID=UPI001BDADB28|nr:DUF4760 domain-containing protein [Morganella morganii]MBT0387694.1 DUF4760 domain-containing protein [Morganella morganii subsp. morganii]